jgi:hypothetical protein
LIAIIALGTTAGLGIVLEFYGDHPTHGPFVLRAIERITAMVVLPGYVLMLVTGLWMVNLSWPFTARWIQMALALWGIGVLSLGWSLATLRKQRRVFDFAGSESGSYRRVSVLGRALGSAFGLIVVMTLYLMVFKPWS